MSKKVLILSSSPRRGGNSDTLCDEFLRGAQEAGHEVEKIFLKDKTIHYCTGCGVCNEGKPCPQKDDAPEIVRKMVAADVIVLATPVYFYTMSAQMKTLIDRCCAGYLEIRDKEFYFYRRGRRNQRCGYGTYDRRFSGIPRLSGQSAGEGCRLWCRGLAQGGYPRKTGYETSL